MGYLFVANKNQKFAFAPSGAVQFALGVACCWAGKDISISYLQTDSLYETKPQWIKNLMYPVILFFPISRSISGRKGRVG